MSQLKDDIVQDVCTASHPVLRPGPVFRVSCFIWMAYLSLRIMLCPLTPSRVLLVGRACCWDRRQASEWRNAAVKCIWGTAGEGSESVWSLESLRVLFHGQIHTHTHTCITIHTFPPICCRCFPTPTPLAKHVWHNAYGNSRTRLPMTKTTCF